MDLIHTGLLGLKKYDQSLIGAVDGVNTSFSLAEPLLLAPPYFHPEVFFNGQLLKQVDDYTITEPVLGTGYSIITLMVAPRAGDQLCINYFPAGG